MTDKYPWYELIEPDNNTISQGDIITDCPIVDIKEPLQTNTNDIDVDVISVTGIIMTQACNIAQDKVDMLTICPILSFLDFAAQHDARNEGNLKTRLDNIRKGLILSHFIINRFNQDGYEENYKIIDFNHVYSVPKDVIKTLASKPTARIRLLPPYREAVSQAFARHFMRVGLPIDIEREPLKEHIDHIITSHPSQTSPPVV